MAENKNNKPSEEEKEEVMSTMQKIQMSLDGAGMVPVYGEVADLANAGLYAAQGDWKNAGISLSAMLPFIGSLGTSARIALNATKYGKKIVNAADKAVDVTKSVKRKISPSKTTLKEPISEFTEIPLPKGIKNVKSKQLPATIKGQGSTTKSTESITDKIVNSKVGQTIKSAYNYVPDGVTKKMVEQGYTPEQVKTGMKLLKGTALAGGVTNAVLSGSSGDQDRSELYDQNTYYNDEYTYNNAYD